MPTVNIYIKSDDSNTAKIRMQLIHGHIKQIRNYIAEELSCSSRVLKDEEVSIRCLFVNGGAMIGDIEFDIAAYAYNERVNIQDGICNDIKVYLKKLLEPDYSIEVWLLLCEMGHGFEKPRKSKFSNS